MTHLKNKPNKPFNLNRSATRRHVTRRHVTRTESSFEAVVGEVDVCEFGYDRLGKIQGTDLIIRQLERFEVREHERADDLGVDAGEGEGERVRERGGG
jgi:hypothetical protein